MTFYTNYLEQHAIHGVQFSQAEPGGNFFCILTLDAPNRACVLECCSSLSTKRADLLAREPVPASRLRFGVLLARPPTCHYSPPPPRHSCAAFGMSAGRPHHPTILPPCPNSMGTRAE
ncbi:hypothetical protein EV701_120139 [Chthoniobacter flavus]|nr:hypothetical protein EV701_120139 [Chthoniobacter flavus]